MTQQQQEQQYDELSMVPANILEQYAHDYSQARAASKVTGFWTRKEVDFPIDTSKFEYVDGVWAETAEAGEQRRQERAAYLDEDLLKTTIGAGYEGLRQAGSSIAATLYDVASAVSGSQGLADQAYLMRLNDMARMEVLKDDFVRRNIVGGIRTLATVGVLKGIPAAAGAAVGMVNPPLGAAIVASSLGSISLGFGLDQWSSTYHQGIMQGMTTDDASKRAMVSGAITTSLTYGLAKVSDLGIAALATRTNANTAMRMGFAEAVLKTNKHGIAQGAKSFTRDYLSEIAEEGVELVAQTVQDMYWFDHDIDPAEMGMAMADVMASMLISMAPMSAAKTARIKSIPIRTNESLRAANDSFHLLHNQAEKAITSKSFSDVVDYMLNENVNPDAVQSILQQFVGARDAQAFDANVIRPYIDARNMRSAVEAEIQLKRKWDAAESFELFERGLDKSLFEAATEPEGPESAYGYMVDPFTGVEATPNTEPGVLQAVAEASAMQTEVLNVLRTLDVERDARRKTVAAETQAEAPAEAPEAPAAEAPYEGLSYEDVLPGMMKLVETLEDHGITKEPAAIRTHLAELAQAPDAGSRLVASKALFKDLVKSTDKLRKRTNTFLIDATRGDLEFARDFIDLDNMVTDVERRDLMQRNAVAKETLAKKVNHALNRFSGVVSEGVAESTLGDQTLEIRTGTALKDPVLEGKIFNDLVDEFGIRYQVRYTHGEAVRQETLIQLKQDIPQASVDQAVQLRMAEVQERAVQAFEKRDSILDALGESEVQTTLGIRPQQVDHLTDIMQRYEKARVDLDAGKPKAANAVAELEAMRDNAIQGLGLTAEIRERLMGEIEGLAAQPIAKPMHPVQKVAKEILPQLAAAARSRPENADLHSAVNSLIQISQGEVPSNVNDMTVAALSLKADPVDVGEFLGIDLNDDGSRALKAMVSAGQFVYTLGSLNPRTGKAMLNAPAVDQAASELGINAKILGYSVIAHEEGSHQRLIDAFGGNRQALDSFSTTIWQDAQGIKGLKSIVETIQDKGMYGLETDTVKGMELLAAIGQRMVVRNAEANLAMKHSKYGLSAKDPAAFSLWNKFTAQVKLWLAKQGIAQKLGVKLGQNDIDYLSYQLVQRFLDVPRRELDNLYMQAVNSTFEEATHNPNLVLADNAAIPAAFLKKGVLGFHAGDLSGGLRSVADAATAGEMFTGAGDAWFTPGLYVALNPQVAEFYQASYEGDMYHLDMNVDPSLPNFIRWDAPMAEQPEAVQKVMQKVRDVLTKHLGEASLRHVPSNVKFGTRGEHVGETLQSFYQLAYAFAAASETYQGVATGDKASLDALKELGAVRALDIIRKYREIRRELDVGVRDTTEAEGTARAQQQILDRRGISRRWLDSQWLAETGATLPQIVAADWLRSQGIDGVVYPSAEGRPKPRADRNYEDHNMVLWNTDLATVGLSLPFEARRARELGEPYTETSTLDPARKAQIGRGVERLVGERRAVGGPLLAKMLVTQQERGESNAAAAMQSELLTPMVQALGVQVNPRINSAVITMAHKVLAASNKIADTPQSFGEFIEASKKVLGRDLKILRETMPDERIDSYLEAAWKDAIVDFKKDDGVIKQQKALKKDVRKKVKAIRKEFPQVSPEDAATYVTEYLKLRGEVTIDNIGETINTAIQEIQERDIAKHLETINSAGILADLNVARTVRETYLQDWNTSDTVMGQKVVQLDNLGKKTEQTLKNEIAEAHSLLQRQSKDPSSVPFTEGELNDILGALQDQLQTVKYGEVTAPEGPTGYLNAMLSRLRSNFMHYASIEHTLQDMGVDPQVTRSIKASGSVKGLVVSALKPELEAVSKAIHVQGADSNLLQKHAMLYAEGTPGYLDTEFRKLTPEQQGQVRAAAASVRELYNKAQRIAIKEYGVDIDFERHKIADLEREIKKLEGKLTKKKSPKVQEQISELYDRIGILQASSFVNIGHQFREEQRGVTELKGRKTDTLWGLLSHKGFAKGFSIDDVHTTNILTDYLKTLGNDLAAANVYKSLEGTEFMRAARPGEQQKPPEGWVAGARLGAAFAAKDVLVDQRLAEHITKNVLSPYVGAAERNIRRAFNIGKVKEFINPLVMGVFDTMQGLMLGVVPGPSGVRQAWKDISTCSENYIQAAHYGNFSRPNATVGLDYLKGRMAAGHGRLEHFTSCLLSAGAIKDIKGGNILEGMTKLVKENAITAYYVNAREIAWGMDEVLRMNAYNILVKRGYAPEAAAKMVARVFVDYADMPVNTRRAATLLAFTPVYTFESMHALADNLSDTVKVMKNVVEGKSSPAEMVLGAKALGLYITSGFVINELLQIAGFDRDEEKWWDAVSYGRKFKKAYKTPEGLQKEIALRIGGPLTNAQKMLDRLMAIGDVDHPSEIPGATYRSITTMQHPIFRNLANLINMQTKQGKPVFNEYDAPSVKYAKVAKNFMAEWVPLLGTAMGVEGMVTDEARTAALGNWKGVIDRILPAMIFPYIRDTLEVRTMRNIEREKREYSKAMVALYEEQGYNVDPKVKDAMRKRFEARVDEELSKLEQQRTRTSQN